jgi:hypothetical protein
VSPEEQIIETLQDMNSRLHTILREIKVKKKANKQLDSQDNTILNNIYNELIKTTNTIKGYLNKDTKQSKLIE